MNGILPSSTRKTLHSCKRSTVRLLSRLARDRSGNTLMMVAASAAPLLAMIGGGIDMGRSYLSESRLQQACDAGVLAARKKLGSAVVADGNVPSEVGDVGYRFFNLNFRDGAYGTENRQFTMSLEQDYSISGTATVDVPTTIMQIFGNTNVPVSVNCEARLNFSNTDVMMVLDTTGSMAQTNPSDPDTRIGVLRTVVKSFWNQLEGAKAPGIRIRYGFVPYSTNVNVGHLLADDWVVDTWTYQSREFDHEVTEPGTGTRTYWDNFSYVSGSQNIFVQDSYPATYHHPSFEYGSGWYSCDEPAPNATGYSANYTLISETTDGTRTIRHYRRVINGTNYWVSRSGSTCNVVKAIYDNYTDEFDEITEPKPGNTVTYWRYAPLSRDVSNWRSETAGCIEERSTYQIDDYNNVDFTRALDLDLDTVPTAGNADTQWRPMYPNIIYIRKLNSATSNAFSIPEDVDKKNYFQPKQAPGLIACPTPARNLAEMNEAAIDSYLASLSVSGQTYHDIGMIWGGRLISPTGLFSTENADEPGRPTSRHLIFLTDGVTEPLDIAYSAYGIEPLDTRRWDKTSSDSLPETVEARFSVACNEVKKRNITVWVVGFGTVMTDMLKTCAGDGHWFQADDAAQLNDVFNKIAKAMGDLRISK